MGIIKIKLYIMDLTRDGRMTITVKYDEEVDDIHRREYNDEVNDDTLVEGITRAIRDQYDPEYTTVKSKHKYK